MAVEMHISVRQLVEFLLRSGDLDNRAVPAPDSAMLEGSRMHRRLQQAQGEDYQAEVPLQIRYDFDGLTTGGAGFSVVVEGRADGIFHGNLPDDPKSPRGPVIDEIKTTYRNLSRMEAPDPVHLAQARCYAVMYCEQHAQPFAYIRMTYVNLDSEDIHYFYEKMERTALWDWFTALMREYRKWAEFAVQWNITRTDAIHALVFPYPYREGQRELAADVYRTIVHGRRLFLEAPTGTGKTIATLFPAIKAMGEGKADKIFYLTAKTAASPVAQDTLELMRQRGLRIRSVVLTAREKVCVLEKPECNPESCPRAAGHYDRINRALYEILTQTDNLDRETILRKAEEYAVCPFELSLDLSLFADVIIGDYNYVFDPHAYLRRFFGEGAASNKYLFLIDEAHNLVDRGRSMYSAELTMETLRQTAAGVEKRRPQLAEEIERCARALRTLDTEKQDSSGRPAVRVWQPEERPFSAFCDAVSALYQYLGSLLDRERRRDRRRKRRPSASTRALQEKILQFYFAVSDFVMIQECMDEHYRIYSETAGQDIRIRLFCMDPGRNLSLCMDRAVSSILFSATLLPIQYYKQLLGGRPEDYEVYARSVFDPARRALLIASDVTSRYTRRGETEYRRIAAAIQGAISGRHGNYLAFFPSYSFLRAVADIFEQDFCDPARVTVIRQEPGMGEAERAAFLANFARSSEEHSLVGFCVLGGIFSEGIDLRQDSLIGAMIVGTGIPQVGTERELLRQYFDERGMNGYDYAYRFPGMNKVLQAAGRVIRTQKDLGLVVLLDERFLSDQYIRLFPREWADWKAVPGSELGKQADLFWSGWLYGK